MDASRWQRIEELFAEALSQPAGERGAFLDRACGDDAELRRELESLLAQHDSGFLVTGGAREAMRRPATAARESLVGRQLGPYEIVAPLGAGGMGEVYRGRDTRLGRSVAIKVMPPHLAADAEARQRFDREARAISALQHPHICALHDVGSQDGVDFLVMELVEGETLAARLERGPLPLGEALRLAAQIADALDRAHRAGIVHRDLKPGNVMLTKSGAKLLDFGLARRSAVVPGDSRSQAMTQIAPVTAAGTILGTLHYMAPEQLEGRAVDQRADLFAFGAMLYEMVTGMRAFEGATPASIISSILRDHPLPVSTRVPLAPPALDALVEHCLAKDPEDRWQNAHDLRLQLDAIGMLGPGAAPPPTAARHWPHWVVAIVGLAAALVAGVFVWRRPAAPAAAGVRFELPPPAGGRFLHSVESVTMAVSPDGTRLAFVSLAPSSSIWIRPLDSLEARAVPGTEGASSVFWSPDGKELGFVAGDKLKRVVAAGGTPVVLCDVPSGVGVNATWGREWILFASVHDDVIRRVPVGGGVARAALRGDPGRGEQRLLWPWFLPDGERFLYVSYQHGGSGELRLAAPGEPTRAVAPMRSRVELVEPGLLLFVRDGALLAQRFDAARAALVGTPLPLVPSVRAFGSTGAASFAAAREGTLVVATQNDLHRLALVDALGKELTQFGAPASAVATAISPDRRRALVDRLRPGLLTYDLWLVHLERGVETRLTDGAGTEVYPVWLPDGASVVYSSSRMDVPNLVRRNLATGRETWLTPPARFQIAAAVTPDGRRLLFRQRRDRGFELLSLVLDAAESEPTPVLPGDVAVNDAVLSPDGKLLAYVAPGEAGSQLFLRPLAGGESVPVSAASAGRFSPDGRTLFFVTPDRHLAAVTIDATLAVSLPGVRFALPTLGWADFEVLTEGRFLALVREVDGMASPLTVIRGWNADPGPEGP